MFRNYTNNCIFLREYSTFSPNSFLIRYPRIPQKNLFRVCLAIIQVIALCYDIIQLFHQTENLFATLVFYKKKYFAYV